MFPLVMQAPVTPKSIGVDLWFSADSLAAGAAATWADLSGNANDASQASAPARFVGNPTGINGQPSATITRSSATAGAFMEGAVSVGAGGTRMTVLAVTKPRSVNGYVGGAIWTSRKDTNSLALGMSSHLADAGYYIAISSTLQYQEFAPGSGQPAIPNPAGVAGIVDISADSYADRTAGNGRRAKMLFQNIPYEEGAGVFAVGPDTGAAGYMIGTYAPGAGNTLGFYDGEMSQLVVKAGPISWNKKLRLMAGWGARYGATVDGRTRVMCLGDSLTRGTGDATTLGAGGYRGQLFTDKLSIVGVGTLFNDTPNTWIKHEGHQAFTSTQIDTGINGYYGDNPAQVVLLHIGTNDFFNGITAAQTAANIVSIIGKMKVINPEVKIIVSLVINVPASETAENAFIVTQNVAILAALSGMSNVFPFQPDILADNKFQADKLHLNTAGYAQWGGNWATRVGLLGYA